jgi:hypothetical protein
MTVTICERSSYLFVSFIFSIDFLRFKGLSLVLDGLNSDVFFCCLTRFGLTLRGIDVCANTCSCGLDICNLQVDKESFPSVYTLSL